MRGLHITAVTRTEPGNRPWFHESVSINGGSRQTGLHADLMRELANRAGFTYEITGMHARRYFRPRKLWQSAAHPPSAFLPEMSWTQYLVVAVDKFDLSLDWYKQVLDKCFIHGFAMYRWLEQHERVSLGIRCPYSFMDLSLLAVARAVARDDTFFEMFVRVMSPFDYQARSHVRAPQVCVRLHMCAALAHVHRCQPWDWCGLYFPRGTNPGRGRNQQGRGAVPAQKPRGAKAARA